MDSRLYEAARLGNTGMLKALLEEDPLLLERGLLAIIPETCLHIATLAGRMEFVKEIVGVKPEFATKLNRDGFAPIHMASANGYAEIVKELLAKDRELGRQKSADGRTALHFATVTGSVAVLRELVTSCPDCKVDLTEQGESALHLALKNNQIEAFRLLFGIMKEINTEEMKSVVNVQDHDGNTILHVAVAQRQHQAVRLMLGQRGHNNIVKVDVETKNRSRSSALEILYESSRNVNEGVDKEICELLRMQQAGAVRPSHQNIVIPNGTSSTLQIDHNQQNLMTHNPATRPALRQTVHTLLTWLSPMTLLRFWLSELASILNYFQFWTTLFQEIENSTPNAQSAIMVVAVLIATVTYQSILSPVGGFQQTSGCQQTQDQEHLNGRAFLGSDDRMFLFIAFFSSTGFAVSVIIILMLTKRFPLSTLLQVAVYSMSANFLCTLFYISPLDLSITYAVTMVLFALVLLHIFYFITWVPCRFWGSRRRHNR